MKLSKHVVSLACAGTFGILLAAPGLRGQYYTVTGLGSLTPGGFSDATAINNAGLIVGSSSTSAGTIDAFSYSGGVMTDLGNLGGSPSVANAVNNSGSIVGYSITGSGAGHAFSDLGGVMTDLGAPPGGFTVAFGVNDSGLIVGNINTGQPNSTEGFSYSGGVFTTLGTLGGDFSQANAVNNLGLIVGTSLTPHGYEAFSDSGNVMTGLGWDGDALAVNDSGLIVGINFVNSHAISDDGGVITDLGTLGLDISSATGVNDAGVIVGYTSKGGLPYDVAFVDLGGLMTNLNTISHFEDSDLAYLTTALGINDQGDIVGYGVNTSGNDEAFLLTPTTVPVLPDDTSSVLLLTFGLSGLTIAGLVRRKVGESKRKRGVAGRIANRSARWVPALFVKAIVFEIR